MSTLPVALAPQPFLLRFVSLFVPGRSFEFPCDAAGHVDLEALSDRGRINYFFARGMVGRDYSTPRICGTASG